MPEPLHAELPSADRVLAVCAHPDDESFGLGAVLSAYADSGAAVGVLCLTRGEASTLGADVELAETRATELSDAADALGVASACLRDYPDGRLDEQPIDHLVGEVDTAIEHHAPDLLVVFHPDGITGHPDHRQATRAALRAADGHGLPVWAWYVPTEVANTVNAEFDAAFVATPPEPGDRAVTVDRRRQLRAMVCHRSQRGSLPIVERRLELHGPTEHLRPLRLGVGSGR